MYRKAFDYLESWMIRKNKKPIVLRGARQTGKSTLVRLFTKHNDLELFEVNFEENPDFKDIFNPNDINSIIQILEIHFHKKSIHDRTVIFLDEIQAHPAAFLALRYFYENRPEVMVIAAGSLLEFLLDDHTFSMPVGRIEYLFLGPMTYEEFLIADNQTHLLDYLGNLKPGSIILDSIHKMAMKALQIWLIIGGMPEVIKTWSDEHSLLEVDRVKQSILNTFRDDFNTYKKQVNTERLQKVFSRFPSFIGNKIVYSWM